FFGIVAQKILAVEAESVFRAKPLRLAERANSLIEVSAVVVENCEQVQAVAHGIGAVAAERGLLVGLGSGQIVQLPDQLDLILPMLNRSAEIASCLVDEGPALLPEDGIVIGRRPAQQPFQTLGVGTRFGGIFSAIEPVEQLVVEIADLVPIIGKSAAV